MIADLGSVSVETPFYYSLRAAALVLAREIDTSKLAKAPLVKQLVDTIRELRGKAGPGGSSIDAILRELAAPLPGVAPVSDPEEPG
ncbi:hypothetical protein [Cryobacterium fucosi]|uniref:Uncharacterized protein n=1 Tax=Cryobacterium fucosi TaxID=1259157 RepID=A0A4V3IUY8_9MICO|nr:hypothetical protein [Cryobacterium fucosi]TFD74726.1 hypothetical protein E3T48_12435 [Cryobacterium fucosi]